jgi:hypothetical protein
VVLLLPLINESAEIEMHSLAHLIAYCEMIVGLGLAWAFIHWKNTEAIRNVKRIRFDEKEPPLLVLLQLDRK